MGIRSSCCTAIRSSCYTTLTCVRCDVVYPAFVNRHIGGCPLRETPIPPRVGAWPSRLSSMARWNENMSQTPPWKCFAEERRLRLKDISAHTWEENVRLRRDTPWLALYAVASECWFRGPHDLHPDCFRRAYFWRTTMCRTTERHILIEADRRINGLKSVPDGPGKKYFGAASDTKGGLISIAERQLHQGSWCWLIGRKPFII